MDTEIVGTIAYNPGDDRLLIYNVDPDTLPQNTLAPVTSVINPQLKAPGYGLPAPINGTRYLLVDDIGSTGGPFAEAWGSLIAKANDIIQYNAQTNEWFLAFDSSLLMDTQYVTNLTSQVQYRYADGMWVKSYEGWYDDGDWSIVI